MGDNSCSPLERRPVPAGVLGMTALMAIGLLVMLVGLLGVLA